MKLYIASSWRNRFQPLVVTGMRALGHEVYDFRNPSPGDDGFHWTEVDPHFHLNPTLMPAYQKMLAHPRAEEGFAKDFGAMKWADACLLVMPCGRSAHLEAGWFTGQGKPCVIFIPRGIEIEPELMTKLCTGVVDDLVDAHRLFQSSR